MEVVNCPHCGESYYAELYSTQTLMNYKPIWKNGECVSEDPNFFTTYCECQNCGKTFSFTRHLGEITVHE